MIVTDVLKNRAGLPWRNATFPITPHGASNVGLCTAIVSMQKRFSSIAHHADYRWRETHDGLLYDTEKRV
jgi:hypothetical protein